MSSVLKIIGILTLLATIEVAALGQNVQSASREFPILELPDKLEFFPVVTQFSPLPSGKGWKGQQEDIWRSYL